MGKRAYEVKSKVKEWQSNSRSKRVQNGEDTEMRARLENRNELVTAGVRGGKDRNGREEPGPSKRVRKPRKGIWTSS